MGKNRSARLVLVGVVTALLACPLVTGPPSTAVTTQTRTIQGSATDSQQKQWFTRSFDTGERFFGKLRGNLRWTTDTTGTLSATRTVSSVDGGTVDAGAVLTTTINNIAVASRLQVTARPTMQLIFEWQPEGDSYACDNTTFPTFSGDDWFLRRDGGGPVADGLCGAIEVSADDLGRIRDQFGIDLELPEVFLLLDRFFTAGFDGTQSLSESRELFDIKVCKIVTDTFGVNIGDHCDIQVSAVVGAPLTTLGHTLETQLCADGELDGTHVDCLLPLEDKRSLTFAGPSATYALGAACPAVPQEVDVRVTNPTWNARLDDVAIGATADLNVHLTANGDGKDVITLPLPGSISLLTGAMPLDVTYPSSSNFVLHVARVTPDDDAPVASVEQSAVTIDEGSSTTLTAIASDSCTATADLVAAWSIDGVGGPVGPTFTHAYDNDLPDPVHEGELVVTDQAGNQTPGVPFSVTVRNVPPSVQLTGLPTSAVPRGTAVNLVAPVADPGADLAAWTWSFGDGTGAARTATSVADRSDSQSHTYAVEGLYSVLVSVHDGTDLGSASGVVTVFDPLDRLVGSGTFRADSSAVNVPAGSSFSAQATVSYPNGAIRPAGSFVTDFLASSGSGQPASAHLVATSYDWIFESGLVARTEGSATLNGQSGWRFQAEVTRTKVGAQTARVSVTVWRPGVTTFTSPDYRVSGPRRTGNIQ